MAKRLYTIFLAFVVALSLCPGLSVARAQTDDVASIVAGMSLDQKLSQMIMPSIRTWDGAGVTDLDAAPKLAEALQRHQYGGIILNGQNIQSNAQVAKLVGALQQNNKSAQASSKGTYVPYAVGIDEEGGVVTRLTGGTRMTGNMAIGATGTNAAKNAELTGEVIGEELCALGINVDFAPVVDAIMNPNDTSLGTRCFSDLPSEVAQLGESYIDGLHKSGTAATIKHFPGLGMSETDSHTQQVVVNRTLDELRAAELVPFAKSLSKTDLVMTAHITLPKIAEEVTFSNGTKGHYPATMSKRVITDVLRNELGYDGVVVTDALEMGAIEDEGLVPGDRGSVEYRANVAEKAINAGVDLLLVPADLNGPESTSFYDEYIAALQKKVEAGAISKERIDQSVTRLLKLKQARGFLKEPTATKDVATVGSNEHHAKEAQIAQEAVTLLKNEGDVLPLQEQAGNVVLLGRLEGDCSTILYAVQQLQENGFVPKDAHIRNLASGNTYGNQGSPVRITIDYYTGLDDSGNPLEHYGNELAQAVGEAQTVVALTACSSPLPLAEQSPLYKCVSRALSQTHASGGKFVLMSCGLPYDAARYGEADAILVTYMGSGIDQDPTARADGSTNMGAINANVIAGIGTLFGKSAPTGKLPVALADVDVSSDGTVSFSTARAKYERDYGLTFQARQAASQEQSGTNAASSASTAGTASSSQKEGAGEATQHEAGKISIPVVVGVALVLAIGAAFIVWRRVRGNNRS